MTTDRRHRRRGLRPPALSLRLGEGRFLGELPRLALALPRLRNEPRGAGEPVLVLPGLGFGDGAMAPLRRFLCSRGYRARGWKLGVNRGDLGRLLPRVISMTERFAASAGEPVRLVGWSLGGILAREVARAAPEAVARVVLLGSPVVGGARFTVAAELYRRRGYDLEAIDREMARRNELPLPVPLTAIQARKDGVVDWRACVDPTPGAENIAVGTTHLGLLLSPEVYRIVARRLALSSAAGRREQTAA